MDIWAAENVLASGAIVGEGPVWDAGERCLYWVDIERGEVHRFDPAARRDVVVIALDRQVGAVGLREAGGLVLAVREGFATWEPGQPDVTVVATPLGSNELCRFNDGACDPAGRFWAGTMALQESVLGIGALYRLEPDGSAVEVLTGISLSNGIDWSPDGRTMYHVDTSVATLSAYAFDVSTGAVGSSRVLIDFAGGDGYPDGLTVDAAGCIWVAFWLGSRVCRYSPEGELLGVVELPTPLVTSCAFGGPRLEDLYITTASRDLEPPAPGAGDLYVARTGVAGTRPDRFRG
jgi:sugar lactone lactonase YvrE